jgi:hypothetical protein
MPQLESLPTTPTLALDPIVQTLSRQLRGAVSPARIEEVLRDLLRRDFAHARVPTYVPIFLHRAASEALQRERAIGDVA